MTIGHGARAWAAYPALSAPLTMMGVERRWFLLSATLGMAMWNAVNSIMIGAVSFCLLYGVGWWAWRTDPHMLTILRESVRFKTRYDPAKWGAAPWYIVIPHQHPSGWGGHHFFRNASRVTSLSSTDSASSFFSRVFYGDQLLQAFRVRDGHPAELIPPQVVARLREPVPPTQLLDRQARLGLPKEPDDLRLTESFLHVRSPFS